jgi:hypothetical protein
MYFYKTESWWWWWLAHKNTLLPIGLSDQIRWVWLPYCILLSRDLLPSCILSYIKLTIISTNLVLQYWLHVRNYQLCTYWTPECSKRNSNTSGLTSDSSDVKFCPTASQQISKMVKLISSHHVLTLTWWKLKSHFHDIYFTFINKLVTKQNINSP